MTQLAFIPRKDSKKKRSATHVTPPKPSGRFCGHARVSLQRTLGNEAIQRLFHPSPIRPPILQKSLVQRTPDEDGTPSGLTGGLPPMPGLFQPGGQFDVKLDLYKGISPLMAAALGSVTIDGFITGKADISEGNKKKLADTAKHIIKLLEKYPGSTVHVVGHTDAVDSDELNMNLGQKRADATAAVLKDLGVPADALKTQSKGESELLVNTKRAEARNRRAVVRFAPWVSPVKFPGLELTPPWQAPSPDAPQKKPVLFPPQIPFPQPTVPFGPTPSVPKPKLKNWLEEGLKRDPLLKKLPDWMRDKVVDGLKDADEKIAEKVIDSLPIGGKEKTALKALAKAILQSLKGKKFKMPTPPLPGMDPTIPQPKFPKMPGEVIIPGPVIRF